MTLDTDGTNFTAVRVEALVDPALPSTGPGRTPHGNFVLSEISLAAAPRDGSSGEQPVKLTAAQADFSQNSFPAAAAIDGNPKTGWAIHGPGAWNVNRTAKFALQQPAGYPSGTRFTVRLAQLHGQQHTLGHLRVSLGRPVANGQPAASGRQLLEAQFERWLAEQSQKAAHWQPLRPASAVANTPYLTVLDDRSVLAGGDQSKRDVYDLKFDVAPPGITALRLEVLPDDSLPRRGPGRVSYEGPFGDFVLSEFTVAAGGQPVRVTGDSQSFGNAATAIDGDPQSGWSINGQQGRAIKLSSRWKSPWPTLPG